MTDMPFTIRLDHTCYPCAIQFNGRDVLHIVAGSTRNAATLGLVVRALNLGMTPTERELLGQAIDRDITGRGGTEARQAEG